MTHRFETELSLIECRVRLERLRCRPGWDEPITNFGTRRVYGRVSDNSLLLYAVTTGVRNSFRRRFHGKLQQSENGTLIEGEFRMHGLAVVFMSIWFVGVAVL